MSGTSFVNILENWLKINGIWIKKNNRKLNWILILFNFTSIICCSISCIYLATLNTPNLEAFSKMLLQFLFCIFALNVWLILLMNNENLSNIYKYVEVKFYIYSNTTLGQNVFKTLGKTFRSNN